MGLDLILLVSIFFIIAIIYSSAGFGGGSSYIAVLALFPIDFVSVRMIALLCNIMVVSGSVFLFYKNDLLKVKQIAPLILLSIPLAYLGGRMRIDANSFFIILGVSLLVASILMLNSSNRITPKKLPKRINAFIGGAIGFLSGVVGIGGGIFLSPVLHLSRWSTPKVIAATTAFFILVNSIAGLAGQIFENGLSVDFKKASILMLSVFIGGQIGSRFTIKSVDPVLLKKITGILILIVAIRLLIKYL